MGTTLDGLEDVSISQTTGVWYNTIIIAAQALAHMHGPLLYMVNAVPAQQRPGGPAPPSLVLQQQCLSGISVRVTSAMQPAKHAHLLFYECTYIQNPVPGTYLKHLAGVQFVIICAGRLCVQSPDMTWLELQTDKRRTDNRHLWPHTHTRASCSLLLSIAVVQPHRDLSSIFDSHVHTYNIGEREA